MFALCNGVELMLLKSAKQRSVMSIKNCLLPQRPEDTKKLENQTNYLVPLRLRCGKIT
mgnify:CR=1 FL=1